MNLPDRMIHQSVRYVLGRRSYAVGECCDWLVLNWDKMPEDERSIVRCDVEEAFARQARWRGGTQTQCAPLGMDMDVRKWKRVRALWHGGE